MVTSCCSAKRRSGASGTTRSHGLSCRPGTLDENACERALCFKFVSLDETATRIKALRLDPDDL